MGLSIHNLSAQQNNNEQEKARQEKLQRQKENNKKAVNTPRMKERQGEKVKSVSSEERLKQMEQKLEYLKNNPNSCGPDDIRIIEEAIIKQKKEMSNSEY